MGMSKDNINVEELLAKNPDYKGWLYIEDVVDLPVVQTDNNNYYLNHSFSREKNRYGCLFIDKDVQQDSNNLVIHGHNNHNSSMLSRLLNYKKEDFYNEHKEIEFITKEGLIIKYEIIAVINFDVSNIKTFNIYSPDIQLPLINKIKENNIYNPVTSLSEDNNFITISTCDTDYYGVNGRIIIIGVEK